jgi:hypothetical protein
MDFLQKYFCGVFELPLPRNAQKNVSITSKKLKRKETRQAGGWVSDLADFFGRPLGFGVLASLFAQLL